ncbi:acyl carrier protein [Streptomyces microflavus]|uniref:acyl carrier protein n=1 Tax=Streptomyces microflavus TaxID=1919 RepID=UPI0033D3A0DD
MTRVEERVRKTIADNLALKWEDVTPEKHFFHDLGVEDDLEWQEVLNALESEFGNCLVPDHYREQMTNVRAVIDYFSDHKS